MGTNQETFEMFFLLEREKEMAAIGAMEVGMVWNNSYNAPRYLYSPLLWSNL